jgi:hypothetical protein
MGGMLWRVVIVLLCCASCGDDGPQFGIAFLDRVELRANEAGLDYERASLGWYGAGSQCVTLDPSFGGSWGGVSMAVDSFGEVTPDRRGCSVPTLSVTVPDSPLPSSVVEMHDRTASIRATFEPGILDKRTMTLRSHATWQFAAGDTVVIGWSRPEDLVEATVSAFFVVGPLTDTGPEMPHWTVQGTAQSDAITFVVPQPTPASGDGTLLLLINPPQGSLATALTCEGATACTLSLARGVVHDATFTP